MQPSSPLLQSFMSGVIGLLASHYLGTLFVMLAMAASLLAPH